MRCGFRVARFELRAGSIDDSGLLYCHNWADVSKIISAVVWKEKVELVVGAASSRSHRESFTTIWTFRISAILFIRN